MLLQQRPNGLLDVWRQNPPAGGPSGQRLDQVRQIGESLWRAADREVDRTLAGDAQAFLEATRQHGGQ